VDGETLEAHASALRRALQEAGRSGQSLTVLLPTSAESALPDGIPATRVSRASYEEIRKRLKEQALPLAVVVNPSGKALAVVRDAGASFAQVALYAARLLTASGGASR
jgi:hypothetical protein